jgi:hypothetical protein
MRIPRTEETPRTAPRVRVCLSRFTIDLHMKLFFAGATHAGQIHVREQIRPLKTPLRYVIILENMQKFGQAEMVNIEL